MTAAIRSDGTYDFSEYTKYINDIVSGADYAVLNLETTIVEDGIIQVILRLILLKKYWIR